MCGAVDPDGAGRFGHKVSDGLIAAGLAVRRRKEREVPLWPSVERLEHQRPIRGAMLGEVWQGVRPGDIRRFAGLLLHVRQDSVRPDHPIAEQHPVADTGACPVEDFEDQAGGRSEGVCRAERCDVLGHPWFVAVAGRELAAERHAFGGVDGHPARRLAMGAQRAPCFAAAVRFGDTGASWLDRASRHRRIHGDYSTKESRLE